MILCVCVFIVYNFAFVKSLPTNNTALMTTSYSKVSHWSNSSLLNNTYVNEGRSNHGQIFYTQRTDAKIRSGQNLRKTNTYRRKNKNEHFEQYPDIGEVQERFNPRPYFDYIPDSPTKVNDNPSYSYNKPLDSIPTSNPPKQEISEKPANTYGSPYTSYNPTPNDADNVKKPDKGSDMDSFRPTVNYDENLEYDTPPSSYNNENKPDKFKEDNVHFAKYHYSNNHDEAGPPIVQTVKPPGIVDMPYLDHPPKGYNDHPAESYNDHPPKGYNDHPPETYNDHPPKGYNDHPPEGYNDQLLEGYNDHPPKKRPNHHFNGDFEEEQKPNDDMDLNPPPPDGYEKFPEYFQNHGQPHYFDFDAQHHHVYHEVTTTTTPAPKEHERVNQAHYSYYYLGRKLWYIPLYFSVYFIVYVTVLILKSIARHKVQFVQNFDNTRGTSRNIDVDRLENNVNRAIYTTNNKYMM